MLRLEDVHFQAGNFDLKANLSFKARITALLGPSGAGKSTLLNVIAGFERPQSGRIHWQNQDIKNLAPGERPVSILFQDNNLFPHLSVEANLFLAFGRQKRTKGNQIEIANSLARVGLPGFEKRKPASLSGGQLSRVALARVLLQQRPLLLLDEPFAALGPAMKHAMLDLVAKVSDENDLQVLMVSHHPQDAKRIANETAVVIDGRVEAPAPTLNLLKAPSESLQRYLGLGSSLTVC